MEFINNISAGILQNVGLGLLTLIVPVGIYVLGDKESNYSELDRNIKIHLIDGKNFLIELGWVFLTLIFWDSVGSMVKLVILVAWASGIFLIMKRIARVYNK